MYKIVKDASHWNPSINIRYADIDIIIYKSEDKLQVYERFTFYARQNEIHYVKSVSMCLICLDMTVWSASQNKSFIKTVKPSNALLNTPSSS